MKPRALLSLTEQPSRKAGAIKFLLLYFVEEGYNEKNKKGSFES